MKIKWWYDLVGLETKKKYKLFCTDVSSNRWPYQGTFIKIYNLQWAIKILFVKNNYKIYKLTN